MTISISLKKRCSVFLIFFGFLISGCGGSDSSSDTSTGDSGSTTGSTTTEDPLVSDADSFPVDTTRFALDALDSAIEEVSCTLSNGESSTCYSITVDGFPSDRDELGYFCPETITTGADEAGKWFDSGVLYDLTGEFVANLDSFYSNDTWQLYDEDTGLVRITDTQTACEAAARPNVAAEYNNYCVQCDISYYSDVAGEGVPHTFLIPTTPVSRTATGDVGNDGIGVAFNGVKLEAAAPTDAILGAFTIAAFDDCVGHVNPAEGYHYHGANHGDGSCPGVEFEDDGHAGSFGYALDGYAIYSMLNEAGEEEPNLDACRGHSDDIRGYHYHSAGPGENAFIGCFTGETAN